MNIEPISRRSFLRFGAAASVATTAVMMGGYSFFSTEKTAKFTTDFGTLLVLNQARATTFFAFAQAVIPKTKGFPDAKTAQIVERADEEFSFISTNIANDIKTVLDVLEYLPIFYGEFSRFSKMSEADRLAFLTSLNDTTNDTVRAVVNNCRMITFNMYYGHPSTWQAIGYDGPFSRVPQKLSVQRQHYAKRVGGQ
jgi:hypothetical protein